MISHQAFLLIAVLLTVKRMTQNNRFGSLRSGGNDINRDFRHFLDALEIGPGIGGQFLIGFHANGGFFPTGHFFINRFDRRKGLGTHRWREAHFIIVFVADTNTNGVDTIQHIQFGNTQTADAVYLGGTAQGNGIEPATTAGPPGR